MARLKQNVPLRSKDANGENNPNHKNNRLGSQDSNLSKPQNTNAELGKNRVYSLRF